MFVEPLLEADNSSTGFDNIILSDYECALPTFEEAGVGSVHIVLVEFESFSFIDFERCASNIYTSLSICESKGFHSYIFLPQVLGCGDHFTFVDERKRSYIRNGLLELKGPLVTIVHLQLFDRYDSEAWSCLRLPTALSSLDDAKRKFQEFLTSLNTSSPKKVICVDCDNTLWGGVIGESGPKEIFSHPSEYRFRIFRRFLGLMSDQGVLICLVSKNNQSDLDEFVCLIEESLPRSKIFQAIGSWGNKSDVLLSLSNQLSLNLKDFLFIDDSDIELLEVGTKLPMVEVLKCSVVSAGEEEFWNFIYNVLSLVDRPMITEADLGRLGTYRAEFSRLDLLTNQTNDLASLARQLELTVNVKAAQEHDVERIAQLYQRTNQFNFARDRLSADAILKYLNEFCVISCADRFGDYGDIGCLRQFVDGRKLVIRDLILSCRALNRGVEFKAIDDVLSKLDESSTCVTIFVTESARNKELLNIFAKQVKKNLDRTVLVELIYEP